VTCDKGNPIDIRRRKKSSLTLRDKVMTLLPTWCAPEGPCIPIEVEFLLANCSCSSRVDKELESCRALGEWEACELPEEKQALPRRFVYERNWDGRYKARLVAGGHRQQHGLDFKDTSAPTCCCRTVRMILTVSAHENSSMS
jgi:hypothetical protein